MTTPTSGRRTKIRARDVFEAYFLKHHREDLTEILEEKEDVERHYPVFVNFLTMFEEHTEVAESLLTSPAKLLPVLDLALFRATTKLLDELKEGCGGLTMKTNLHARITGLPSCPELYRDRVPRTADVGRLLCVVGTVVRRTSAKMLEYQKEFMCAKCKHVFTVVADHDQYYHLSKPGRCPNPTECYSTYFTMLSAASQPLHTKDYQELKIQEQVQKLKMGSIPGSMWVTLEDDLVDSCRPGDDVVVCGVVRRRWRPLVRDSRPSLDLVLKANNVTVDNKERSGSTTITEEMREEFAEFWEQHKHDPLTGRNIILASICPEVYGLYVVKLALAVVVAGGVQKTGTSNTRIRGEAHLLLVGDPGTAKSQFLKYASGLVPRSVFTTGTGTTSTGLTVTVVREEGEWALEAGALVMADGGVCCIDEFSSVREADRAAIHEAMEQQTISVAKAGLLCKLDSRCSVLAATNPKEDGNPEDALEFIGLASPLLSRFDLVLMLLDMKNQEWDRVVSQYILNGQDPGEAEGTGAEEDWGLEKLRAYFCVIRSVQPRMTVQANEVLSRYYQVQRQSDQRSKARTTLRLLESLVRLSQGHARLLMREEVGVQDAVVAISLLEASMGGFSAVMDINPLYTAFPHDACQEYRTQVQVILQKLSLPEILSKELTRLDEENKHLASSRRLSGMCKKKGQPILTSTQKFPSTAVLQSRKDFKPPVNEESFGLDIEELNETTDHRKRPRGGTQQTLNKWVEPDSQQQMESPFGPQEDDFSDDDLELIKPKKQKSRKKEEKGKNTQTQVKNIKCKKIRKKPPKTGPARCDTRLTDSSPPSSISHMDKAGEELLKDLDDFAQETWTPNNARENFISSIAKFAYKKIGKDTNTKQVSVQETSPKKDKNNKASESIVESDFDYGNKKTTTDRCLPKTPNGFNNQVSSVRRPPLKEKPARDSDLTEMQQKGVISNVESMSQTSCGRESQESEKLMKSPIFAGKGEKQHQTLTSSRESVIAKLKQFSYLPPDDETVKTSTQNSSPSNQVNKTQKDRGCSERQSGKNHDSGSDKRQTSSTQNQDVTIVRQENVSEEERLSLTHAKIKEAREKRLNLASKMTVEKIKDTVKENKISSNLMREREQSHHFFSDPKIRDNVREMDQAKPSDSKNKENVSDLKIRENVRDIAQPLIDSKMKEDRRYPDYLKSSEDSPEIGKLLDKAKRNATNIPATSSPNAVNILNTPSSSSSSSSTTSYFPKKPKLSKIKRFSFALSEEYSDEEDMDIFASPVSQAKVSDNESEKQGRGSANVTSPSIRQPPQAPPVKKPFFSPSPVLGRIKLPVVSEGTDKYKALASDELDDFDFDL